MLLFYCKKCGCRIPQKILETRGANLTESEQEFFCAGCEVIIPEPIAAAPIIRTPQNGTRTMRPTSDVAQAPKTGQTSRLEKPATGEMVARATGRAQRTSNPASLPVTSTPKLTKKNQILIGVACGFVFIVGILVLVLSKNTDTKKIAETDPKKNTVPETPPSPLKAAVGTVAKGTPNATGAASGTPSLALKEPTNIPSSLIKDPTQNDPVPPTHPKDKEGKPKDPNPPNQPNVEPIKPIVTPIAVPAPASGEEPLTSMTDPAALRDKLLAMQHGSWPKEAVKHLGDLPSPAIGPQPPKEINPSAIQKDYGSKLSLGTFEGEKSVKLEGGTDRVGCFVKPDVTINHTHLKIRMFQTGLKKIKLSCMTFFRMRFNHEVDAPPEGAWSDLDIDVSKYSHDKIKLSNMPIEHIEIQGFRSAADNGAYFIISKFEIVNGVK
jgi:hypothetical protein